MVLLGAVALAACVTTQRSSERLKLRADRTLAARKPSRVHAAGSEVAVRRVALVRSARRAALVVELVNRTDRAVSDVPVTVGVGRRPLNARGGLGFYDSHVAAIAPHASVTWVFTMRRRPPRGRPFALAGDAARSPGSLPQVLATLAGSRIVVHNTSEVPQYGLPVYAVARRGARYVAAGRATVDLGAGASIALSVPLIGAARGAAVHLQALPTIYR